MSVEGDDVGEFLDTLFADRNRSLLFRLRSLLWFRLHVVTFLIRRTLLELERDLGAEKFSRIHRSIIVNVERIQGLELQPGGEYEVVLKSKVRLQLSRRFRKRLQDRMAAMSIGG